MSNAIQTALNDAARFLNQKAGFENGFTEDFHHKGISVGYIGDVTPSRDDRCWRFFHPHPNAQGSADSWGYGSPEQLLAQFRENMDSAVQWAKRS